MSAAELARSLAALRLKLVAQLPEDEQAIRRALAARVTDRKAADVALQQAAHRLAGASGMLGLPKLSDQAIALETAILAEEDEPAVAARADELLACIAQVIADHR